MPTAEAISHEHAHRNFMFLTGQINRQWRRIVDRKLQPLGLSEAMWLPLLHLARASEPMRQKDLAASLSLDSSSVVRLLDGLQAGKLVVRLEGSDRRAKTIHLTPLGQATVEQVQQLIGAARQDTFAGVSEPEIDRALHVLERIAASLAALEQGSRK